MPPSLWAICSSSSAASLQMDSRRMSTRMTLVRMCGRRWAIYSYRSPCPTIPSRRTASLSTASLSRAAGSFLPNSCWAPVLWIVAVCGSCSGSRRRRLAYRSRRGCKGRRARWARRPCGRPLRTFSSLRSRTWTRRAPSSSRCSTPSRRSTTWPLLHPTLARCRSGRWRRAASRSRAPRSWRPPRLPATRWPRAAAGPRPCVAPPPSRRTESCRRPRQRPREGPRRRAAPPPQAPAGARPSQSRRAALPSALQRARGQRGSRGSSRPRRGRRDPLHPSRLAPALPSRPHQGQEASPRSRSRPLPAWRRC
mmetsp:Transcript_7671/g.32347  ORF Transcript_7671/g.32347 Transcript_7671/m.32347 type:complete len:309 (+) Transcript_7671:479-1405(+)